MKGSFNRREPACAQPMDVSWGEMLTHPHATKARPYTAEERDAAAAAAAAAPAGAVPADPARDMLKQETIYPPKQRFVIDERLYFIEPRTDANPSKHTKGEWLVGYTTDEKTTCVTDAGGAGADMDLYMARPESSGRLPNSLKDTLPATDRNKVDPYPDPDFAQQHVHFVLPRTDNYFKVGSLFLQRVMEKAEQADYEFALRMQGLQNSTINAVWVCSNAGAEPADRSEMMEQFLRHYMTRFLSQAPMAQDDPETVIREAVQMHQQYCAGWVREHTRGLAPTIEAAGEALIGMFFNTVLQGSAVQRLTWKQACRLIRRDPRASPQFGLCLHFYMVKLEQDRGGRNASYKSMFNASSANMLSLNAMDAFLRRELPRLSVMARDAVADSQTLDFHPSTVDWYGVVSQLSLPVMRYTGTKRGRQTGAAGPKAPWET